MLFVVSISDHLARRTASSGRTYVNNCHSISICVSNRIDAFVKDSINLSNSLGERAGIFCFFWFTESLAKVVSRVELNKFFSGCPPEDFIQT